MIAELYEGSAFLEKEMDVCKLDPLLIVNAEEKTHTIVEDNDKCADEGVVVERTDLRLEREIGRYFGEVETDWTADWITVCISIPLHHHQIPHIRSVYKPCMHAANAQRTSIFIMVADRINANFTTGNARGSGSSDICPK